MANFWASVVLYVTASTLLVINGAEPYRGHCNGEEFEVPSIITFGDSTADAGTNNFIPNPAFLANFTPYGQSFYGPTGRFSDGRLWVDFLAQELGHPVANAYLNPAFTDYSKGVNFASAGSGNFETTKTMVAAIFGGRTVVNTDEQIHQFRKVKASFIRTMGRKAAERLFHRSIYLVSTGSNDVTFGYLMNATMQELYTPDNHTTRMINAVYNSVKAMYAEGARKIVINGLGPLGCLPATVAQNNGSCLEAANHVAKLYNSKLPALQHRLSLRCPGSFIVYTERYEFVQNIIKNGSKYGFTMGSHACCGTGPFNGDVGGCGAVDGSGTAIYNLCPKEKLSEYVFWDYAHPTDRVFQLIYLSPFTQEKNAKYIKPYNTRLANWPIPEY